MREAANLYRRLAFAAVILLCAAPIRGETAHAIGGVAVLGSLILYLVQGLGTLRLNIAWHVGYLTIIVNEGLQQGNVIRLIVDATAYDEASRYITAANAAALLVRSLAFNEKEYEATTAPAWKAVDNGGLGIFIAALYSFFVIRELPSALQFSQIGHESLSSEMGRSAEDAIFGGIATSAGVILPSLVIYYIRFSRGLSNNLGLLVSAPILIILYMTGIRFLVLMAAAGAFVLYVPITKTKKVPFLRFGVLGIILYASASTMAVFRSSGFNNTSWDSVETYYTENLGMHAEGVVTTLAKMVDYFRHHDYLAGRSSTTLLFFWIPRQFWSDKPTFIDYWFIREYEGETGFSQGFSTGSTFSSDAFVDFGFIGGVVYSGLFFGLLLAILDRIAARVLAQRGHPYSVVVAPLFGGALFAVRSFNTAVIQMSGVLALGTIFALLCGRSVTRLSQSNK